MVGKIMNEVSNNQDNDEKLKSLKTTASIVYLCQVITFLFAGLPLLIGVTINFLKRKEAEGAWLESHFNWQINMVWITLAGFAITGFTLMSGLGFYILLPTLVYLVYRIAVGWTALMANKPIKD